MNYTENYQLPLWDADDAIKRTDFNNANSAIDAAVAAATSISGSYTSTPGTQVNIDLGFRPKLVIAMTTTSNVYTIAVMMDGMALKAFYDNSTGNAYIFRMEGGITDSGFYISANAAYFNSVADNVCYYTVVR